MSSFFPEDFDAAFRSAPPPSAAPPPPPTKRGLDSATAPASKRVVPPFLAQAAAAASMKCQHGLPMLQLTVRKPGPNVGRPFFRCAQQPPCDAFEWADTPSRRIPNAITAASSTTTAAAPAAAGAPRAAREPVVCKFEAVDDATFSLSFQPFSTALVDHLKTQQGRWNDAARHWLFPLSSYDALLESLKTLPASPSAPLLDLTDELPKVVRKWLAKEVKPPPLITDETLLSILPPHLASSLLPFQLDGVRFALSKGGRVHLADEMGVGKVSDQRTAVPTPSPSPSLPLSLSLSLSLCNALTAASCPVLVEQSVQAIAVMSWYSQDWPVLIVCPSSLRLNWESEILKWHRGADDGVEGSDGDSGGSGLEDRIDVIFSASDRVLMERRLTLRDRRFVTIVSYNLVSALAKVIADVDYGIVVADESHMIKSHDAKRTRALLPILKLAKRALLLSGTPALNRPAELFTQLHALVPGLFTSFQAFGNRYCDPGQSKWGRTYDGGTHLSELHLLLKKHVMIRRMKADVLPQLPPKRRQAVLVDVPVNVMRKEMKSLQRIEEQVNALIQQDADDALSSSSSSFSTSSRPPRPITEERGVKADLMRLFSVTAEAKAAVVIEYCLDLLDSLEKFLVFFHHQSLADALSAALQKHSVSFIRIDGATPAAQRQQAVDLFQSSASHRVALLSITAASTGFTLTAASTVIFAELFWSPAWLLQAEDRVHRIGTHAAMINIQYILGKNTVDECIWPMLDKKLSVLGSALNGLRADASASSMQLDQFDNRAKTGTAPATAQRLNHQPNILGYMMQQPPPQAASDHAPSDSSLLAAPP